MPGHPVWLALCLLSILVDSRESEVDMKKLLYILGLSVFTFFLANCNQKATNQSVSSYHWDGSLCYNNLNQQSPITNCQNIANTNYYMGANGQCLTRATNQPVATQLCQTGTNNGYSLLNGRCYQVATNQEVPVNYCQQTGMNGQCIGTYYNGSFQPVICAAQNGYQNGQQVYNCSGVSLYNSQMQVVNCP